MAQTLQGLRAAVAKTERELEDAERALARIEADFVAAKNQVTEVTTRITSGVSVSIELATVVSRLQHLEQARVPAETRVTAARDAHDEAQEELDEFVRMVADTPDFGAMISLLDEMADTASNESMRCWSQTGRDLVRVLAVLQNTPASEITYGERTVAKMLAEAMVTHLKLREFLRDGGSPMLSGVLQVPEGANLESRGISQGGKSRYHWEVPANFSGRSGRAYIELYIER